MDFPSPQKFPIVVPQNIYGIGMYLHNILVIYGGQKSHGKLTIIQSSTVHTLGVELIFDIAFTLEKAVRIILVSFIPELGDSVQCIHRDHLVVDLV